MKKSPIFFAALLLIVQGILGSVNLLAAASAQQSINRSAYCAFLNKTAAADPSHLYDEKMAGELGSASIVRSGTPGNYCYEAKGWRLEAEDSEKNTTSCSVAFISYNDAAQYCAWKNKNAVHSFSLQPPAFSLSVDPDLKSNILTFSIESSGVTASQASGVEIATGLSAAEEGEGILGALVILLGGGVEGFAEERINLNSPTENNNFSMDRLEMPSNSHSRETSDIEVLHEGLLEMPGSVENFSNSFSNRAVVETTLPKKEIVKLSLCRKISDLPLSLLHLICSFLCAPEISNEVRNVHGVQKERYKQKYQKAFEILYAKNSETRADFVALQNNFEILMDATSGGKRHLYKAFGAAEKIFPLNLHVAFAFRRAGTVMEIFHSFQKKWFEALTNQTQKDISILLASAFWKGEQMNQVVMHIRSLFEKIQTCKEKSEQQMVQATPQIAQAYKDVVIKASRLIDASVNFAKKTEMKDALKTRYFLQAQDLFEKELEYLILRAEEFAILGRNGAAAVVDNFKASHLYQASLVVKNAGKAFQLAVLRGAPPQAMKAYEKGLKYSLLNASEIAANGESNKTQDLFWAAQVAQKAGIAFEENDLMSARYYLKRAKIYKRDGMEDGNAFTFKKYLKENLSPFRKNKA